MGNVAATPPAVLSASGSQSGTTSSAIAEGGILITSGDAASANVAATISRDTANANEALTKQFDAGKRQEIAQGFEATRLLVSEVGTFFNNRAAEEKAKKDEADHKEAERKQGVRLDANGKVLLDANEKPIPLTDAELALYNADENTKGSIANLRKQENTLHTDYGAGSNARRLATAFVGAAGGNVTGSLGSLVQGAAVNVLQSLAVSEVKKLADNIQGDATTRETVRAALQAVVGCAGAAAGGSGDCGSAAAGAAASVVLNNLLASGTSTATDKDGKPLTLEEQQARTNLVASLVAAIASAASADASAATTAAIIETENNSEVPPDADENPVTKFLKQFLPPPRSPADIREAGGTKEEAAAAADAKFQQDAVIRGVELEKTILEAYSIVLPGAEAGLAAGAAERGAARGAAAAKGVPLTFDKAARTWTTPGGLVYGQGSAQGNRIKHVLEHTVPNPAKPVHSVFNVGRSEVLGVVDEAWTLRQGPGILQKNGNRLWDVDMGRVVGTNGQTSVRVIVKDGTTEVITAFPR